MSQEDKDFIVSAVFLLCNLFLWVLAGAFRSANISYVAISFGAISLPLMGILMHFLNKEK